MRGNSHVLFLGEEAVVTPPPYPTVRSCVAPAIGRGSPRVLGQLTHAKSNLLLGFVFGMVGLGLVFSAYP